MENKFTFKPLLLSDIPLMHKWFNLPHVKKFYSLREWTEKEVLEKLKPIIQGDKLISGFIVLMNERPIGYVQLYKIIDYPWPNQNLTDEIINNAAGMDLFIGEETMFGKGIGIKLIEAFIAAKIWPKFQYCIVDPNIDNIYAIRCYEKLNFRKHIVIETTDALDHPAILYLMILKRPY